MQPINTNSETATSPTRQVIVAGHPEQLLPGRCIAVDLGDGTELALFNVGGEFYAIDGYCPHRGAPLSEGYVYGEVVECALHGWQFDVRNGECLTVPEKVRTYEVFVEDGLVKIEI